MDQHRVHRQIHACERFDRVRPIGAGGGAYKEYPWRHMAPYRTGFSWQGKSFQVGTTDEENDKPSTSGARLYMTGLEKLVHRCFSIVVGLLPQSDFDDRDNNHAVCHLADGRNIKWGCMPDAHVYDELGLPSPGLWAKMLVDERVQAITTASRRAEPWPNNSQPRQLLTKLAGEVAHRLLQEGCVFAGGASEEDPGVSAGSSQSVAASYLESMDGLS